MKKYLTAVLVILFSLAPVQGQDPGFFLDDWQERSAILPEYEWKEKTTDSATVQVRVDAGQVVKKVPRHIYGNNAVVWGKNINLDVPSIKERKQLNTHVLRRPCVILSQEDL